MENKLKFSVNFKPLGYFKCKYFLRKGYKAKIKKVMSKSKDVRWKYLLLFILYVRCVFKFSSKSLLQLKVMTIFIPFRTWKGFHLKCFHYIFFHSVFEKNIAQYSFVNFLRFILESLIYSLLTPLYIQLLEFFTYFGIAL